MDEEEPLHQVVLRADGTIEFHDFDEPPVVWAGLDEFAADYDHEQTAWNAQHDENGPATEFTLELACEAPDWAVGFFRELVTRVSPDTIVGIGCGPLEDLARHESHDPGRIEEIVAAARDVPEFQTALSNVWLGDEDLPKELRDRLSALGARDFAAEHAMTPAELAEYTAYRDSKGWGWG